MNDRDLRGGRGALASFLEDHAFWIRWAVAALGGYVTYHATPVDWPPSTRILAAWDLALVAALAFPWWVILRADATLSRTSARASDPGTIGLLLISLVASLSSLAFAINVLDEPGSLVNPMASNGETLLVVFAVLGGWFLLQTGYALHYARLYYTAVQQGKPSGLEFTDAPPDDLDFAYFAFGVGMSFQTSDVPVTSGAMRRVVLAHGLLSFLYNFAIFGLMVNLIAGRL